jgi:6-phosphogluconate dehydrogenase (decarboxylating)
MTQREKSQFGMIGMAVMGRNLALNILDHGFSVAAWNLEPEMTESAVHESRGRLAGTASLQELVMSLQTPRRIMMMIQAGKPVDIVIDQLRSLLEPGDIVIDGGNSWFEDTRRREAELVPGGFHFVGVGVSGGEEGARHGPSLMPGGDAEAYGQIRPVLEAIAAVSDSGPCVTHVGPDGAGHFVKMVHNGIEYADMQLIAEAYHLLHEVKGLTPPQLSEVFGRWNRGPLESFLIDITARLFAVRDEKTGGWLVDSVLDRAGQKGTGRWSVKVALDLEVPVPSIAAAVDARVLSSLKEDRVRCSKLLVGPAVEKDDALSVDSVHNALYVAKAAAYAQGMALIRAASKHFDWNIDTKEIARIWKGGCIIRARFLDTMMRAYEQNRDLDNLFLDEEIRRQAARYQDDWRRAVITALRHGIPVPGLASGLAYYDSIRTADLPQNLIQAQRDAFGAHTYQRKDDPGGPFIHSEWL